MSAGGGIVEAFFLFGLANARAPGAAVLAWCGVVVGHCMHDHGYDSNKSSIGRQVTILCPSVHTLVQWGAGGPCCH